MGTITQSESLKVLPAGTIPSLDHTATAAAAPQDANPLVLAQPILQSTPAATSQADASSVDTAGLGTGSQGDVQQTRAAITAEVERSVHDHLLYGTLESPGPMNNASLQAWLVQVQFQADETARAHAVAKETHKRVDAERAAAREVYRTEQHCSAHQNAWKCKVLDLKNAQTDLKYKREAFYRASAAVETLVAETRSRAGTLAGGASLSGTIKRKRVQAPEEECPYCEHTYTVRDGLSAKVDDGGARLHLRKCQCREKTPPCRNCPKCKYIADIMTITDVQAQQSMCQIRFKCEICSCKCPGAGKWVESDEASRESYERRTAARHTQLQGLGWNASAKLSFSFSQSPPPQFHQDSMDAQGHKLQRHSGDHPKSSQRQKDGRRSLKRLPQDIRHQLDQLQGGNHLGASAARPSGAEMFQRNHFPNPVAEVGRRAIGSHEQHHRQVLPAPPATAAPTEPRGPQLAASLRPQTGSASNITAPAPPAALPALPGDLLELVDEVFQAAAGPAAVAAVRQFLQSQRATSLEDLQFLELSWMQAALNSSGLTPLLLNKFLSLAKRRCEAAQPQ